MRIVGFLARRLLYSLIVLIGVLIVVFALVHLVPGAPVRIALYAAADLSPRGAHWLPARPRGPPAPL